MTVRAPDMTAPPMPANPADARALDRKLRASFRADYVQPDARRAALAQLRADLGVGRYGGVPLKGDAPAALVTLLDHLGWTVALDRFARAMPHFPRQFGSIELCETLARLGYTGTRCALRIGQMAPHHVPAIAYEGDRMSVLLAGPDGSILAIDPATGAERPLHPDKRRKIISFAATDPAEAPERDQKSWLGATVRRFRPEIVELFGLTGAINLMVLVVSFSVMTIYDKVIPAAAYDTLAAITVAVAVATFIELTFRRLKARLIGRMTGRLEYLLGTAIFAKLISLPLHMITNTPVGDQIGRLRQFESVRDLFAGPFVAVGLELPYVALFTIGLFAIAGPLGFVPVVLMIVYALVGALLLGPIKRQALAASRRRREHYQMVLETVSSLRQLRAFGCEEIWLDKLAHKAALSAAAKRRAAMSQRILTTISTSAVPIAGGATVVLGAVLVIEQAMTVGMLIGGMIVIWRVLAPIQQLFMMLTRYTEMVQMTTQIDQMMRLPSTDSVKSMPVSRAFTGAIAFDRVSFRYQAATHTTVQGLSFAISPGELIAIEGHSGAGKSTVLRLMLDLHRPQVGSVMLDGINVRQIPSTELRAAMGYVPQNPTLFHGTIAQNLRLIAPDASDARLLRICEELGLLPAISQLKGGIDTLLDHAQQEQLPGGFRQALSIAQALLREPPILLFDEPAKSLDHELEAAFLAALDRRRGKSTIVMVSHRPSHIRLADRVLSLNQGAVVSFDAPIKQQAG